MYRETGKGRKTRRGGLGETPPPHIANPVLSYTDEMEKSVP
jgi:hypothetical protein